LPEACRRIGGGIQFLRLLTEQQRRAQPRRRQESTRSEDKGGILSEYGLSEEQGNEIIMAARAHWFEDEDAAPKTEEAADAESSQ